MARIPETEVERLKRETDLAGLVERSGVKLKKHGADRVGLCPFHEDREPSLVVSPSKGLWHCLGACGTGGSAIDWVMRREGLPFREAVAWLQARTPGEPIVPAAERTESEPTELTDEDAALLEHVVAHYETTLKASPRALAYLESRGLTHPELLDRFRLGFADRTLSDALPGTPQSGEREEVRKRLERIGVLRENGREHFRGCVVIPVVDERGRVSELYGRTISNQARRGHALHRYLPGAHRGVWNRSAIERTEEIILCESLLDALTFWVAGYRAVTASYGVNGFTADHRALFRESGVKRVKIAYDADQAGERAAESLAAELGGLGIEAFRVQFPWGTDANAYALQNSPASESLGALLAAAVPMATPVDVNPNPTPAPTSSSLAASLPEAPAADVGAEEITLELGDRRYRVRGLGNNRAWDVLRVNLFVGSGDAFHVDTLDLYQARRREAFVAEAARALGASEDVVRRDLGRVLLTLEEAQDRRLKDLSPDRAARPELTADEKSEALELLRSPDLLDRIVADFERAGVVGEEENKLIGYVAAVSRKLDRPLAVVVQSASAAGKSSLMDAVLEFVPEEERVQYSALTGQSLFYMNGSELRHKVLAVVEEAGAERASYALKLLQSEGELTIASTGKDPDTGRLVTHEYRVEGPVMIFLTTTATELDEELLNRCLVLTVDEGREQTRRVHRIQRESRTLEGLLRRKERDRVLTLHRNAQRLLRPLAVVNPYAPKLTFLDDRTRTRRDHEKYLTLIDAVALLHQHQRPVKKAERGGITAEYVEVTPEDIEVANRLAEAVLGRSLDELPPQSRRFLDELYAWVEAECERREIERAELRFTAREVREALGTGATQTKVHLSRLVGLEYVLQHRDGTRFRYELLYAGEGDEGRALLAGLVDVRLLRSGSEGDRSALNGDRSGRGRAPAGGRPGVGRTPENGREAFSVLPLAASSVVDGRARGVPGEKNGANRSHTPARNGRR